MAERINKARYWWAVLYPENMIEDWENALEDKLQVPFAYAIHEAHKDGNDDERKTHVHIIIAFNNTTTYKHASSVFGLLNADGKKAFNKIEACVNIRHCYDYLIHNTDSCKKAGKELLDPACRISGNNFDIGAFEQLGLLEKRQMLRELTNFVIEKQIVNMADFYLAAIQNFPDEYYDIYTANNRVIESLTRGNYLKYNVGKDKDKEK